MFYCTVVGPNDDFVAIWIPIPVGLSRGLSSPRCAPAYLAFFARYLVFFARYLSLATNDGYLRSIWLTLCYPHMIGSSFLGARTKQYSTLNVRMNSRVERCILVLSSNLDSSYDILIAPTSTCVLLSLSQSLPLSHPAGIVRVGRMVDGGYPTADALFPLRIPSHLGEVAPHPHRGTPLKVFAHARVLQARLAYFLERVVAREVRSRVHLVLENCPTNATPPAPPTNPAKKTKNKKKQRATTTRVIMWIQVGYQGKKATN